MGAKRKARNQRVSNGNSNVIDFNTIQKKHTVQLLPRNRHQENYILKLLDDSKSIVFAIGPAGTGKTMLAVLAAVKKFKEGSICNLILVKPSWKVQWMGWFQCTN